MSGVATLTLTNITHVVFSRAQLKAAILMSGESSATLLEDVATQVLISGQLLQPQDIEGAINKITTADVQAVSICWLLISWEWLQEKSLFQISCLACGYHEGSRTNQPSVRVESSPLFTILDHTDKVSIG